ncbi:MAG: hypothetical protein ACYTGQ_00345 [Planctomycetota bacterium]|jgi:hypothetical protein
MTSSQNIQPFPLGASSATLVVASLAGTLVAAGVLAVLGRLDMVGFAAWATGACLLGSLLGQLPVWYLASRQADGVAVGFMLAVLVRVIATAAGLGLLVVWTDAPLTSYAGWAAPAYGLLLAVEVWLIKRYLERCGTWPAASPVTEQAL